MAQRTGSKWKPFLIWLFANILGFASLGIAILTISGLIARTGVYGTLLFISLPISFAQWIALRRILHIPALWIFTVPIGMLVCLFFIRNLSASTWGEVDSEATIVMVTLNFVIGSIIALPQWIILRRYCSNASLWILGTALGTATGVAVLLVTDLINQSGHLAYVVAVLLYSILTGLTLMWLVEKPGQSPKALVNFTG